MEFVDDEVAKALCAGRAPERPVFSAQKQEVEHLVVRKQNVGRVASQHLTVGDAVLSLHDARIGTRVPCVEPYRKTWVARLHDVFAKARKAPRLVGRERVHRIDDDRLDAVDFLRIHPEYGVDHRQKETLGLARARTGRNDRGLRIGVGEALKSLQLMRIGNPVRSDSPFPREMRQSRLHVRGNRTEGTADLKPGTLDEVSFLLDVGVDNGDTSGLEGGRRNRKFPFDEGTKAGFNVAFGEAGEHEVKQEI